MPTTLTVAAVFGAMALAGVVLAMCGIILDLHSRCARDEHAKMVKVGGCIVLGAGGVCLTALGVYLVDLVRSLV